MRVGALVLGAALLGCDASPNAEGSGSPDPANRRGAVNASAGAGGAIAGTGGAGAGGVRSGDAGSGAGGAALASAGGAPRDGGSLGECHANSARELSVASCDGCALQ